MNKKNILFGIACVFLLVLICGCIDNSNENNIEKMDILGVWNAYEESHIEANPGTMYYTWSFYENDSILFEIRLVNETLNESISNWLTFRLVDSKLIFEQAQGASIEYNYTLSKNKDELTVTKDNITMIFTKSQ